MDNPLANVHGDLLIVRPPVPVTVNKAGANYKSEVTHLEYSPGRAFDEWVSICDAIVRCGGDALFDFETADEPFLDVAHLEVDADGDVRPAGSRESRGRLDSVLTGRVFTANGPWVVQKEGRLLAVMPNMLTHRRAEQPYYQALLGEIADGIGLPLELRDTPDRWEGMADVAVVGERVVLTYAVPGHYDEGMATRSPRSSREGISFAADAVGVPASARIYVELRYPHFHGDTVHFGARPPAGEPVLVHYPGGLYGTGAADLARALGPERIRPIESHDAVEAYAGNSRQVREGVLVPDGVSGRFLTDLEALGLLPHKVPLFELFGKAGGGPACATLYLPKQVVLPSDHRLRYSQRRNETAARRLRLPQRVSVDPNFFRGKQRG